MKPKAPLAAAATRARAAVSIAGLFWRLGLGALLLLTLGASLGGWRHYRSRHKLPPGLSTQKVRYEPFTHRIHVRGSLEPAFASEIYCRVRNAPGSRTATTIRWIIEEGTPVKRGQVLVELDDSGIEDQLQLRRIWRDQAWSAWMQAEANHAITIRQNEGDIQKAQTAVELAAIDLQKYERGDYEQTRKELEGRLLLAEADFEGWRDRVAWSDRMVRKGYVGSTQARGELSRLQSASVARDKLREEQRVLQTYTHLRTLTDLQSDLAQAHHALAQVKRQAKAREVRANSDRLAKHAVYRKRDLYCGYLETELKRCIITAPHDGVVVYDLSSQSRSGNGDTQSIIAQGEPVREGQRLLLLPDVSRMVVNVRVHEALIGRVESDQWAPTGFSAGLQAALLVPPTLGQRLLGAVAFEQFRDTFHERDRRVTRRGQPAEVRVDGAPERVWRGHVREIGVLPSQDDSYRSDVRVYQALISIDEDVTELRQDMTADVTIVLGGSEAPVLTVPTEALVGTPDMGRLRKCFVVTPEGLAERDVTVGTACDDRAEVRSGLSEGDEIVTNPRGLWHERAARSGDVSRAAASATD